MTRRACIMMLGAGLCIAGLPGCAWRFANPTNDEVSQESRVKEPHYPGLLQVGPEVTPPRFPQTASPPIVQVSKGAGDGQKNQLPPGHRVGEFFDPPEVLQPRLLPPAAVPGQDPLPRIWREGSTRDQPPPLPPVQEEKLVRALECLLRNQSADAIQHLQGFDPPTQELCMRLLSTLEVLNRKNLDQLNPSQVATLQEQVQGMLAALRGGTDLVIDKMCLCERIDGFGQYKEHRDGHLFKAGTHRWLGDLVQVYVELRNIDSRLQGRYYVTALHGKLKIHNEQGQEIQSTNYRGREQQLQSLMPHFDCHLLYSFHLGLMPPGKYKLIIEITDEACTPHRIARQAVDFVVGSSTAQ